MTSLPGTHWVQKFLLLRVTYIVTCQRGGVFIKPPDLRAATRQGPLTLKSVISGPVSCRRPGGSLETLPRWDATLHIGHILGNCHITLFSECLARDTPRSLTPTSGHFNFVKWLLRVTFACYSQDHLTWLAVGVSDYYLSLINYGLGGGRLIEPANAANFSVPPNQICSSWIASSFIMFIRKPPTELLKSELSVTFGSGSDLLIWSK